MPLLLVRAVIQSDVHVLYYTQCNILQYYTVHVDTITDGGYSLYMYSIAG